MTKSIRRKCPIHKHCWDYGNCAKCAIGNEITRLHKKIDRLTKKLEKADHLIASYAAAERKREGVREKTNNKLVRDKIPAIIEKNGKHPVYRILDDTEYIEALEKKLDEEIAEFHESKSLEELADILEVLYALCGVQGHAIEDLVNCNGKKYAERGGFSKRIFLMEVKESD